MKVSVIVPMYNVEKYVGQCLDSLEHQTLKDLQVIMVDDGCTDSTCAIAQAYVDRHPGRFQLVHKELGNLGEARNFGIPCVRGKYLAFLDSDDWVEDSLYEKMADIMEKEDCDVCVTDIEYWWKDPAKRYVMHGLSDWKAGTINKRALLSPMFSWNKMYKASLFGKDALLYPTDLYYEDVPITSLIFAKAKKIGYLHETLMHYRQREDSMMGNTSNVRIGEIFDTMARVREEFEKEGLYETYYEELEYLHAEHLRLYGMFRFIRSDHWKEWYDESCRVMMTCFPKWKKNRYLKNLSWKNRIFLQFYGSATAWLFNAVIRK